GQNQCGPLCLRLFRLSPAGGSLIEFGRMIKEETGKTAFPSYTTYGCYCGLGGKGWPRDATDRCCQAHDCCYQALSLRHCKPKVEKYFYSAGKDTVTCGETECRRQTCECDKAAALCFRRSMFQDRYICYPNHLCQGPTPPCQDSYSLRKGG
uniref:Phospholipase A2 group IIE n=1 Tax=Laticauda laticaudata TaxID=8630 RepID=A0A8C5RR54_LATLA